MAKLVRKTFLQFGSTVNAGSEIGQFGSYAAPVYSADIDVIQAGTAWPRGWAVETIATNRPFLEDQNAVDFVFGYMLSYILQMGIPEYDASTTYYANSYVQVAGALYKSLTDTNVGNTPASSPSNWAACIDLVAGGTPTGTGAPWFGGNAAPPSGWLVCDGSAINRTTYAALFAVIGTTWGAGNGSTTFNLPDTRGNTLVGYKAADGSFGTLGANPGEKTHTLTTAEMPSHTHDMNATISNPGDTGAAVFYRTGSGISTSATGGDGAHNNIQPSLVATYIIKT